MKKGKGTLFLFTLLTVAVFCSIACVTRFDHCSGNYYCLTESQNISFSFNKSCSVWIPETLVPKPGICQANGSQCVFVNPCLAWNKTCVPVNYSCTSKTEYKKYISNHTGCMSYRPLPLPMEQCLYINSTCNWYDGCTVWLDCRRGYQCGTVADKYIATHSNFTPSCDTSVGLPRGECIYQSNRCVWSSKYCKL